jgi:hypothetical protein
MSDQPTIQARMRGSVSWIWRVCKIFGFGEDVKWQAAI